MANDSVTVIQSVEDYRNLINAPGKMAIIDFWAEWCAPCRAIAPRFEKLAQSNTNKDLVFAKVELKVEDPDHWTSSVANDLKIVSIPYFVAMSNGTVIGFQKGAGDLAGFISKLNPPK